MRNNFFLWVLIISFVLLISQIFKITLEKGLLQKKIEKLEKKIQGKLKLLESQITLFEHREELIEESQLFDVNNEMLPNEADKTTPIKLRIIIPSTPRKDKGYEYLEKTFESIKSNFEPFNVDFNVFTFSSSSETPKINHPKFEHFRIEHLELPKDKTPKISPDYVRAPMILRQNLDWVSMMKKWITICRDDEIFLYMEDDFLICDNAESHLLSIYLWAQKYRSHWKSIRTSIGFNGLFMQCKDIHGYIKTVWEECLNPMKNLYPLDYALGVSWSPINSNEKRVHFTFKYNLFYHIGKVSTVGNEIDGLYAPKCYDGMAHSFNFYLEKFDTFNCEKYMISPCFNRNLMKDFDLHGKETIQVRPLLSRESRYLLTNKTEIDLFEYKVKNEESCSEICEKYGRKCEQKYYIFANSCDEFKSRFPCKYCVSQMWGVWDQSVPFYTEEMCVLHDHPRYNCHKKFKMPEGTVKVCPCKK